MNCKIFAGSVFEIERLEENINAWIKANTEEKHIYVFERTQSQSSDPGDTIITITLWYQE